MDKAIEFLQEKHPWLTYAQGVALIVDSHERHLPYNNKFGATKTLVDMDVRRFGRETRHEVENRLAVIAEWL